MQKVKKIVIEVPASTGNLGCGFDVLSAALDIKNRFIFTVSPGKFSLKIRVSGSVPRDVPLRAGFAPRWTGKNIVALSGKNTVWKSALAVFKKRNFPYKKLGQVEILEENRIPRMKGLGSSAAARLAGAFFANEVSGKKLNKIDILKIVGDAEGHYDNASASLFGGITITVPLGKVCPALACKSGVEVISIKNRMKNPICFAVPDFCVSTNKARRILPDKYSKEDVIFNLSRISSLLAGIYSGKIRPFMFEDRIHTPFRKKLIHGFDDVKKASLDAGALGVFISGSGSSVGAIAKDRKNAGEITRAMKKAFAGRGIKSSVIITKIANEGIRIKSPLPASPAGRGEMK